MTTRHLEFIQDGDAHNPNSLHVFVVVGPNANFQVSKFTLMNFGNSANLKPPFIVPPPLSQLNFDPKSNSMKPKFDKSQNLEPKRSGIAFDAFGKTFVLFHKFSIC